MSDDKYIGHKLEQILDEVKAVHELVADVATRGEFNRLEQKVDTLSDSMEVVKAVADLGREVEELKSLPAHVAHGRA
jgi:uncharacterized protein YoxC